MLLRLGCRLLDWLLHVVGVHQLDSWRDVNVDVDSRRREISLGKRPVDCTIGECVEFLLHAWECLCVPLVALLRFSLLV